jgi:hypothetical protein
MYNLRYHIASLVAVFLSLSIGLLLGTIVVERGALDRQKETIVQSLQQEFQSLASENNELSAALGSREDLVDTLLAASVEGTLEGRTILVLASTGRADGLGSVNDAIESAGGTAVTLLLSRPSLGLEDPEVSAVTTEVVGPVEADALLEETAAALAAEWVAPGAGRPLTEVLTSAGVMRVDGDPGLEVSVDGVVVLAYFDDAADDGALAVAAALADAGYPGCGAEAQSVETGVAPAALEAGLSAVDHMGTPEGAYSLTWILTARASGYYGLREGAQAPWPE